MQYASVAVVIAISLSRALAAEEPKLDQWKHHLVYPGTDGVQSIAFSPDGNSVYVHLHGPMINVWPVAVHYWPEIVLSVLALLTVILALRVVRVMRRRQTRGVPYCRRCNYNLSSHVIGDLKGDEKRFEIASGVRCPECGVDLARKRPRRGRTARRRLALVGTAWLVIGLTLAGMVVFGVPRDGSISKLVSWPSMRLAELVTQRNIGFLSRWIAPSDLVLEVDVSSGRTVRTVLAGRDASYLDLRLSPDGRWCFLGGPKRNEVTQFRLSDGRRERSLTMPGDTMIDVQSPSIIGFSPDGLIAHVQWCDTARVVGGISACNLQSGESEVLVSTPVYVDTRQSRNAVYGRHFLSRGTQDPPRFISRPHFMEAYPTKTYNIRRHSSGGEESIQFQPSVMPAPTGNAVVTRDGRFMFLISNYGLSLLMIDIDNGETAEVAPLQMDAPQLLDQIAINADGTILAGGAMRGVRVFDVPGKRWIGSSRLPAGLYAARCWISPDNRWLAAVCQKSSGGPASGGATHELVLWDLSSISSAGAANPTTAGKKP